MSVASALLAALALFPQDPGGDSSVERAKELLVILDDGEAEGWRAAFEALLLLGEPAADAALEGFADNAE